MTITSVHHQERGSTYLIWDNFPAWFFVPLIMLNLQVCQGGEPCLKNRRLPCKEQLDSLLVHLFISWADFGNEMGGKMCNRK
jgi:hypothetical protein